jgi:hypothetical protein
MSVAPTAAFAMIAAFVFHRCDICSANDSLREASENDAGDGMRAIRPPTMFSRNLLDSARPLACRVNTG